MRQFIKYLIIFLCIYSGTLYAAIKPLPVDHAFQLRVQPSMQQVDMNWRIAPGYFLYRDRFKFRLLPSQIILTPRTLPTAIKKQNPLIGNYAVYSDRLALILDLPEIATDTQIEIQYQGCSEKGFCYPPQKRLFALSANGKQNISTEITTPDPLTKTWYAARHGSTSNINALLHSASFPLLLIMFLGFGLLLTFTPCVLPMIPIVSSMIIGQGKHVTSRKALGLSTTYVISMACTYALLGFAFAWLGKNIQASLQTPLALSILSFVFVLMALALFDVFTLKLPGFITSPLVHLSQRQHGGTYRQAIILGFLATLMVSPCITPPLVGALSYIAQTGDLLLGSSALFALGLGMGIPLILIVTVGHKILPKSGPWMQAVKILFGLLLLAIAIELISRFAAHTVTLLLWAGLALLTACFLGLLQRRTAGWLSGFKRLLALAFFALAIALSLNAYQTKNTAISPSEYTVTNLTDLQSTLQQARSLQQSVIIDFYADWCLSCQVIEKHIFANKDVQRLLAQKNIRVIRADVTVNDNASTALQNHYEVIAPPTLIFIDKAGQEMQAARTVGDITRERFMQLVEDYL